MKARPSGCNRRVWGIRTQGSIRKELTREKHDENLHSGRAMQEHHN